MSGLLSAKLQLSDLEVIKHLSVSLKFGSSSGSLCCGCLSQCSQAGLQLPWF